MTLSAPARVRIQHEDFDVAREVAAMREGDARVGAVASFIGTVRDRSSGISSNEPAHHAHGVGALPGHD